MIITSVSEYNVSFSKQINMLYDKQKMFRDEDPWVQFLQDHRELIVSKAQRVELTEETMQLYNYRIDEYVKARDIEGYGQVFRIVNRLYNDTYFVKNLEYVYIPNIPQINELKKVYLTNRSKIEKMINS